LLLARQAEGRQGLCSATVAFFLFILFNNHLEQRDLRIYEADLCQIFRVGRHAAVSVRSGICFAIAQGTLSWQLILGTNQPKSMKRLPSWDVHSTTDCKMPKWMDVLGLGLDVLSASHKNLANFGPLT